LKERFTENSKAFTSTRLQVEKDVKRQDFKKRRGRIHPQENYSPERGVWKS